MQKQQNEKKRPTLFTLFLYFKNKGIPKYLIDEQLKETFKRSLSQNYRRYKDHH